MVAEGGCNYAPRVSIRWRGRAGVTAVEKQALEGLDLGSIRVPLLDLLATVNCGLVEKPMDLSGREVAGPQSLALNIPEGKIYLATWIVRFI